MSGREIPQFSSHRGSILEVSRRFVTILDQSGKVLTGRVSAKNLDVVAGDVVQFEERDGDVFVTTCIPGVRNLYRSAQGKLKRMGANIDSLLVITASGPTFNPVVIDRMLVAARVQSIPATLVVNKVDMGLEGLEEMLSVYRSIGVPVLPCSAKYGQGMNALEDLVGDAGVSIVALCGVSGVGKSTILNKLIPGAKTRVGSVSTKTGQGKQTTTQPRGYLYGLSTSHQKMIIDLPGVQFFGLSHLSAEQAHVAFQEIYEAGQGCRYGDCKHIAEPACAVRDAVAQRKIAEWRYESYRQILAEIDEAKPY